VIHGKGCGLNKNVVLVAKPLLGFPWNQYKVVFVTFPTLLWLNFFSHIAYVANFHGDAHNHKEGRLEVKTGEEINTKKNREREGYRSTEGRLEVKTEEEINTKKKTEREKVIGVLREKDQHTK
jgi:hypothetical protein